MLVLSKLILKQRPYGFLSAIVVGKRSSGKSVYSLNVASEIFQFLYGVSEKEAYNMAIDNCVFTIDDVIKIFQNKQDEKRDIVIWDDAGVFASGGLYHTDITGFALIKGLMDTARTSTHSLLLTTPSQKGVAGFLQNYDDYLIRITSSGMNMQRKATGYSKYTLPSGSRRIRKVFLDTYSCYLNNEFYNRYEKIRFSYKENIVNKLVELRDRKIEKVENKNE